MVGVDTIISFTSVTLRVDWYGVDLSSAAVTQTNEIGFTVKREKSPYPIP